jgi:hypothetical protein
MIMDVTLSTTNVIYIGQFLVNLGVIIITAAIGYGTMKSDKINTALILKQHEDRMKKLEEDFKVIELQQAGFMAEFRQMSRNLMDNQNSIIRKLEEYDRNIREFYEKFQLRDKS